MDDYIKVKKSQIRQYQKRARQYRATGGMYLFFEVLLWITIFASGAAAYLFGFYSLIYGEWELLVALLVILALAVVGEIIVFQLRRHAVKSSLLLQQFIAELKAILQRSQNLEIMKEQILTIETNFLSNDDELYTKKFIWHHFLEYMDIKMEWDKDEKERRMRRLRDDIYIPAVWMNADPLNVDNEDTDFVQLNWELKMRLRELFFKNYRTQRDILEELGANSREHAIVYERFLRNKKISKKLKQFKKVARVFYLSAAAKMKLIYFVDSVLQDRPYVEQCDEMVALIDEKNAQIRQYTADFWRIHRRSLKFYLFEMIWLALLVPVLILSGFVFANAGMNLALVTFYIGAGIVVAGEMILVTRQLRDLKSKKLVPSLIASLMGIRHSMCSSVGADPEVANKYARYFKEVEKHFMLTVTEVEAVKYAKENVTDKVFEKLSDDVLQIRHQKDQQAQKYYERFNYYRGQCVKYGALEAFVALLVIPVIVLSFYRTVMMGGLFMELYMEIGFILVGLAIELVLLVRHIRVDRRKELFLLIYQKMSVILSDYTIFSDKERLLATTSELEESIINAAASDGMQDVVDYVREWQADHQKRNTEMMVDQAMSDAGKIFERIPGKERIERFVKRKEKE
ncbi:MAG: hypothetical protein FWE07_01155 [Turicibacter sp.]|nr:hypothetical protein [Turicibacter sp.]